MVHEFKKKAEESLAPSAETAMDSLKLEGGIMACTGEAGLPTTSFLLAAFCGDNQLFSCPNQEELQDIDIDKKMCDDPNLLILLSTAAKNYGISSNY